MAQDITDIHPHVISDDPARHPLAPLTGEQSTWSRERPATYPQLLRAMDEAGIARAVLVQASTCYGHDNRYVAEAVAAHPDRFRGVFSVDMLAPDAAQNIARWVDAGLEGLRVFIAGHTTSHDGARLDDPRAFPAWEYAVSRGLPVAVQLRAHGLPQLVALLERFPQARVVLDHFARPELDDGAPYAKAQALFDLARFSNLFFKYTTHNVRESAAGASTPQAFLRRAVDAFGAERIAWGSNFPASAGSLPSLLRDARQAAAQLAPAEQAAIFGGTAQRLYTSLARTGAAESVS
ncbi:amidohydrolase family protein [Hydrogenophaga sp. BPS33]|uniref:amidohydrolase family protein n=1 Tax=Hydrogenophaga sp. BPS33 TaxID=2651974 RepID=UPI0013201C37|nr:amidohydrolase family protein [Hydrogenophaga sp. BPS33]QHE87491.1 amidohydrolase [Hydrogenophaga sp. BPS33]